MKDLKKEYSGTPTVSAQTYRSHKKHLPKKALDAIFIIIMLAYPVTQFAFTWVCVNFGALTMAFNESNFYDVFQFGFGNFKNIFLDLQDTWVNATLFHIDFNKYQLTLINSFGYAFITVFISLPLSLMFSYFLHKKMPASNVFRAIFFLPNIIPIVALTLAFNKSVQSPGYLYPLFKLFHLDRTDIWPNSQLVVYIYCVWAGLGYNIILFSGAIGRIPKELFESAELDHAGYFKEFFHVVIPCIWPTIVTLVVMGMTHVLTLYLHPLLLTEGDGYTWTIAYSIFESSKAGNARSLYDATAYGLFFSLIWAPVILLVRRIMSKKYQGIGY